MLNAISDFFQRTLAQPEQRENQTLTLELATAALLCEIVRADYENTDEELAALRSMLTERYRLSASDVDELMALAQAEVVATELGRDDVLLVNLSGRGDKDVEIVAAQGLEAAPPTSGEVVARRGSEA